MMTRETATRALNVLRIPSPLPNFFTLPSSTVEALADAAREHGYRKPRLANGSTARYFYAYLERRAKAPEWDYEVQGFYAGGGWECVACGADMTEARAMIKDHRRHEPNTVFRIKKVRAE